MSQRTNEVPMLIIPRRSSAKRCPYRGRARGSGLTGSIDFYPNFYVFHFCTMYFYPYNVLDLYNSLMYDVLMSKLEITTHGFDWGKVAIERCFESQGMKCIRIRHMESGRWIDVYVSEGGRHMWASEPQKDKRLKGFDPCGGKKVVEVWRS